jgi:3-oxoacyl-[acyl-carrier protein] reductase
MSQNQSQSTALIFGARGSIGSHIFQSLTAENAKLNVIGVTSKSDQDLGDRYIYVDCDHLDNLLNVENVSIVVWAQGHNFNDNIENFNHGNFQTIINANVTYILRTLNFLLANHKICNGAKMVIISSVWEEFTRDNKLSYSISKSALSSMVKNLAYDLSEKNILINNVLPGVIDNPMSRSTLDPQQILYIENCMKFGRLITVDDVYKTVKFLVCENTGITGQSIKVDLGFTNLRKFN